MHFYESLRTVLCVRTAAVNSSFCTAKEEMMKCQIQNRPFSQFAFLVLQYHNKVFDANLQVARVHVPPYTVLCLVRYFLFTSLSPFFSTAVKKLSSF